MIKKHIIFIISFLFLLWVLFSGKLEYIFILLGFLSIFIIIILAKKTFIISQLNLLRDIKTYNILLFIPYLLWDLIKANLNLVKVLIKNTYDPQIITIKNTTISELGEYILAISISITPGTLIIEYNKKELLVHVLDNISKENLLNMRTNDLVARLEKDSIRYK